MASNANTGASVRQAVHEGFLNMRGKGNVFWQLQYYALYDDGVMTCFDDPDMAHKKESIRVAAVESIESLGQLKPRPLLQSRSMMHHLSPNPDFLNTSLSETSCGGPSSLDPSASESIFSTSGASSISVSAGRASWDQTPRISRTSTGSSSHNASDKPFTFVVVHADGEWILSALSKQDFTKWLQVFDNVAAEQTTAAAATAATPKPTTSTNMAPPTTQTDAAPIDIDDNDDDQKQTLSLVRDRGVSEDDPTTHPAPPQLVRGRPGQLGHGRSMTFTATCSRSTTQLDDTILTDIHSIVEHVMHGPQKQGDKDSSRQSQTQGYRGGQQQQSSGGGKQQAQPAQGGGSSNAGGGGGGGGGFVGGGGGGGRRRPSDEDRKYNDPNKHAVDEKEEDDDEDEEDDDKTDDYDEDSKSDEKSLIKSQTGAVSVGGGTGRLYAAAPVQRNNNNFKKKPQVFDSLYEPHESLLRGQGTILISKQLTSKILPSRVRLTSTSNMFYLMDKWTAVQCHHQHAVFCHPDDHGDASASVLVLNYDFRDKTSSEYLYCVARQIDPSTNRNFSYRMDDRLYTALELKQYGFAVPLSSRLSNAKFMHLDQNLQNARRSFVQNLARLIQLTEWHKLRVYDCNSSKRRMTLSMTKLELRHTLEKFARSSNGGGGHGGGGHGVGHGGEARIIPMVAFVGTTYKISYVWMAAIDEQCDVQSFIGVGFDYDAERGGGVVITALHLNMHKLQQQHQLIHPEHECRCFAGCQTSMITDLVIGNPTELTKAMRGQRDVQSMQQTVHNLLASKQRTIQELQARLQRLQARVNAQAPYRHPHAQSVANTPASNVFPQTPKQTAYYDYHQSMMTSAPMIVWSPTTLAASSCTNMMMNVAPSTSVPTSTLQSPPSATTALLASHYPAYASSMQQHVYGSVPINSLSASNITALLSLNLWPPPPCPQSLGINKQG